MIKSNLKESGAVLWQSGSCFKTLWSVSSEWHTAQTRMIILSRSANFSFLSFFFCFFHKVFLDDSGRRFLFNASTHEKLTDHLNGHLGAFAFLFQMQLCETEIMRAPGSVHCRQQLFNKCPLERKLKEHWGRISDPLNLLLKIAEEWKERPPLKKNNNNNNLGLFYNASTALTELQQGTSCW